MTPRSDGLPFVVTWWSLGEADLVGSNRLPHPAHPREAANHFWYWVRAVPVAIPASIQAWTTS